MRPMKHGLELMAFACVLVWLTAGCGGETKGDPKAEAPPQTKIEHEEDVNLVQTDHPEQFPLVAATDYSSTSQIVATGAVTPDISRTVPVVSLATGRVVEIKARLGDQVKKGQVLLVVQSADMSAAFSDYRKAVADEKLTNTQYERAKLLYDKGAISLNDMQVAEVVNIVAPISGVITDQQVTNAAGIPGLGSPNPFTISDLSTVWIICDVYENDLPNVHVGETAEIRLNAYPGKVLTGRISNVSPVLDPTIRTSKVRIEVANPSGILRVGMFVTATFRGQKKETRASVPASAILHLHDRDWVYVPAGDKKFRRLEVVAGQQLPGNLQEIVSGVKAGQQVVSNALVLQNTVEQ